MPCGSDINAMAGERAAERKANIRELGYRNVELVRNLVSPSQRR